MTNTIRRFADQDARTLSLLARVQRETGYVPTLGELSQLLQCSTTAAACQRLNELVIAGEGTRLIAHERQEMAEIAERHRHSERQGASQRRHSTMAPCSHVRWADRAHDI